MDRRTFLRNTLAAASFPFLFRSSPLRAQSSEQIIVIGAGIAGLAAAATLVAEGYTVTVLEARDRIGGRIWTNRDLGFALDLGASWIHESVGNPITTLAQSFGAATTPTDYENIEIYGSRGRPVRDRLLARAERVYGSLLERAETVQGRLRRDRSIGRVVNRRINRQRRKLRQVVRWIANSQIVTATGADLDQLSLAYFGDDDGFAGGDDLFPGGYDQIVTGISQGLTVTLNQSVSTVEYGTGGVTVQTQDTSYNGDRVIVTVPLGVLKAGSIIFTPGLPDSKQVAVNGLAMGVLNKIALRFPTRFWSSIPDFISNTTPNEIGEFLNWSHYLPTANALLGFVGGSFGISLEDQSDEEVVALALKTLRRIYGSAVPEPDAVVRTRWNSDPFAFGSYSYIPVGGFGEYLTELAIPIADANGVNRVLFAGEATTREYPNTVHGAYLSGLREAQRIVVGAADL